MENTTPGLLIVISAPSGAGKTTICKSLRNAFPDLRFSVSCTTRPPRKSERDGEDYHFISVHNFKSRIEKGEFLEWEEIYGHCYGTSIHDVEDPIRRGYDIILDIDTKGATNVKAKYPGGVFVFVMPPSIEILKERLRNRGSETDAVLQMRFARAMEEIRENEWYDYVIFNDIIENSVEIMKSIYVAEKNRRSRQHARIDNFYHLE
ncbi:MAG TPA: guanylate kinase [Syntrophales bacterium]|nr:guanylate kinase [Syntrophales bacterium]HPQ43040.1 guanylate kinase [Syntrophales bacterium]